MPKELENNTDFRGAPMGRRDHITEPDFPIKFHLVQLRWVDGDYDQGGAYWGNSGGTDIFHAWGNGKEEEQEMFIRATSRTEARCEVRKMFPNCRFYK